MSANVTWHAGKVSPARRAELLGQRGAVVWLTGLSGSGKSTIAVELEQLLLERGHVACMLDGDNVRHGLCSDLGFSAEDRRENVRRVGCVAQLFASAGVVALASFISPFRADRDAVRARVGAGAFYEVHVATPVEICERRDPKGLYARARAGDIADFTGISAPYEAPESPELVVDTVESSAADCAEQIYLRLARDGVIKASP